MARGRVAKGCDIDGWIVFDKPVSMRSMQATSFVRSVLNARKAGHAGTLDPLASGVLPIALGRATRAIAPLIAQKKTYRFTVRWGVITDTLDADGCVTHVMARRPSMGAIKAMIPEFVGALMQRPPLYSALRVQGKRAYQWARAHKLVELMPRPVHVYSLRLAARLCEDEAVFECCCGQGTYVRSLARDMAQRLGTCGHICALRRLSVGPFLADDAVSYDVLRRACEEGKGRSFLKPVEVNTALPL